MNDDLETTSFDTGIARIFEFLLSDVHTCLIGEVTAFDAVEQTVSVQPVLKRKFAGVDTPVELPIIEDVPVVFLGSGNFWVTIDIQPGSYVLLVVCERSIASWLDRGGIVDPERSRKFDLSDAIAIPGINPSPDKISSVTSNALEIRNRGGDTFARFEDDKITMTTKAGGTILLNGNLKVLP